MYSPEKLVRPLLPLLLFGTLSLSAQAQVGVYPSSFGINPDSETQLIIETSPPNPKPNTVFTLEIKTGLTDLKRANIAWLENGSVVSSGVGKTTHTTATEELGRALIITVVVQATDGNIYEKSITLKPATVDMIWEAQTIVPPFYKGKALYTLLGGLKVVAIPEVLDDLGKRIDAQELIYTWTNNGKVLGQLSGLGRNSLVLASPGFRTPFVIDVSVADHSGAEVASERLTINEAFPRILIYENSPLYGLLFNREVGPTISLGDREVDLEVYPYFFNAANRDLLSYSWRVNTASVQEFQGPIITLRTPEGVGGEALVSLEIKNPRAFTDYLSRNLNVSFGNK